MKKYKIIYAYTLANRKAHEWFEDEIVTLSEPPKRGQKSTKIVKEPPMEIIRRVVQFEEIKE